MAKQDFHEVFKGVNPAAQRPSLVKLGLGALLALVSVLLLVQYSLLGDVHKQLYHYAYADPSEFREFYPDEAMQSPWAQEITAMEGLHLSLLHQGCLTHKNSVIPWTYGKDGDLSAPGEVWNQDDPDLLAKIRQCPDVDIFLPEGIRSHGYCEDSIAYAKFLQSRMLPAWAITMKYVDPATGQMLSYHDLCPKTPMIFLNHYWDGINEKPDWPTDKPLYLMPNIEMYELEPKHYWSANVVLCKTAICARRVRQWYVQEGNPKQTQVLYTRHTSSDVALYARATLGADKIARKNFSDVRFIHAIGTSVQKGTNNVLDCWLERPDFPPLELYVKEDVYDGFYRDKFHDRIVKSKVKLHLGRVDADVFGKMLAEAAFFMCTSIQEGYGHYINQARANSGVIISTDVPPMNEFFTPESGVLVPATRTSSKEQLLGGTYDKDEHGLRDVEGFMAELKGANVCAAVERVLHMTVAEREHMAALARKQYLIDMRFFASKMTDLRKYARNAHHLRTQPVSG